VVVVGGDGVEEGVEKKLTTDIAGAEPHCFSATCIGAKFSTEANLGRGEEELSTEGGSLTV
jgi:hypothetical protein